MSNGRRIQQRIGWFAFLDPFGLEFRLDRLRSCMKPFNGFEMYSAGLCQLRLVGIHAMKDTALAGIQLATKFLHIVCAGAFGRMTSGRCVLVRGNNTLRGKRLNGSYLLRQRGRSLQQEQGTNHRRQFHVRNLGGFDTRDFEAMPVAMQDPRPERVR